MSLAERLLALENEREITCKLGTAINDMDEETKAIFMRVIKSKVSTRTLTFALNDAGIEVGRSSVGLHRAGRCSCKEEK